MKKNLILSAVLATCMAMGPVSCSDRESEQAPVPEKKAFVAGIDEALLQQRTTAYASLVTVPADTEVLLAVHNIGATIQQMAESGVLPAEAAEDSATMWDGGAIALGPQAMSNVGSLIDLGQKGQQLFLGAMSAQGRYMNETHLAEIQTQLLKAAADALKAGKLGPVYVSLSATPENTDKLAALYNQALVEMNKGLPEFISYVECAGMKGFKFTDLGAVMAKEDVPQELVDAMAGRDMYLLSKQVGNSVVITLAEDPADIRIPATAAESILGTNKLAQGDASLSGTGLLTCYCSPEFVNMVRKSYAVSPMLDALTAMLKSLPPASLRQDLRSSGIQGITKIATELKKLDNVPAATKPFFLKGWVDSSAIHMDLSCDAGACRFKPAKQLVSTTDSAFAALYVECSPVESGLDINLKNIVDGTIQAIPMFGAINGEEVDMVAAACEAFTPVVDKAYDALEKMSDATTGAGMLLVQENGATAAITLKDRRALEGGWTQLLEAARSGVKMAGKNPAVLDVLLSQVTTTTEGSVSVYVPQMPEQTESMTPSLAVSDSVLAISTQPANAAKVAQTDLAAAPEFSGFKFNVNMQSLASLLAGLRDRNVNRTMKEACQYVKGISATADTQDGTFTFSLEIKTK